MRGSTIAALCIVALFAVVNIYLVAAGVLPADSQGLGIIVAAALTLAIYSFLYKDNPFYRFAEHLYVGIGMGYIIIRSYYDVIKPKVIDALFSPPVGESPSLLVIPPLFFGILLFSRFFPRQAWISRWSFAFFVGMGSGLAIPRTVKSLIMRQVEATIRPVQFFSPIGDFNWMALATIIAIIGVFCVLVYFFFSIEHRGPLRNISKVGVWFLMIAFGAAFGYTVMGRISLLIERVQFLLTDWLHITMR